MTNREKFREVFKKDIYSSNAIHPQILALKSAYIDGIDCMEEWLNAEYKEPTTKNNLGVDCISRQEVLRLLANSIGKTNTYLQTKVLKMSPVIPIRPKGRWLCLGKIEAFDICGVKTWAMRYECTKCGFIHFAIQNHGIYSFCPNCSAEMESNTKRKGKPIEGNNESYNCENWIP